MDADSWLTVVDFIIDDLESHFDVDLSEVDYGSQHEIAERLHEYFDEG